MTADARIWGPGIYAIRNTISGRIYVGSSTKIGRRWVAHRNLLRVGSHHSVTLQRSWKKHGEEAFSFGVIEAVENPDDLSEREQYWIDRLHAACPRKGFNLCPAAGSCFGLKHTKASRAAMSAGQRASGKAAAAIVAFWENATPDYIAEHAAKISAKNKGRPNPRRSLTPEQAEQVRRLKNAGWTYTELATHFGMSGPTLLKVVRGETYTLQPLGQMEISLDKPLDDPENDSLIEPGVRKRRTNHVIRKLTFEQAEEIRALRKEGWRYADLERKSGLSRACLLDIVNGRTYARP